ncbi:MAG: glutathione S-transferase [Gammaproteobacteria bacterium]|nr:glutathione S-transferase [Gammaproteobacteria bacterium]
MTLYGSNTSPYVRKVIVTGHELGIADQIRLAPVSHDPVHPDAELNQRNPLGKIPTLVTAAGIALFDSRVICEYLDSIAGGGLLPKQGDARWAVLVRLSLADGILDAAVLTRYEQAVRPESLRWPEWIDSQMEKVRRALAMLAADEAFSANRRDLGTIATACALGYLDFRYADENWRDAHPRLADWYADFQARPSMRASAPE